MFTRLKDSIETGRDTLRSHYGDAESRLLDSLRDAGDEIARRRDTGFDLARSLSSKAIASGEQAGRSLGSIVRQRPAESVLLVAVAAFAAGWLVKHLRKGRTEETPKSNAARPRRKAAK